MPHGMALIVNLSGSYYCCLEQIFMAPKGFEPSKFYCMYQFIKPFLDKKCLFLRNMETLINMVFCFGFENSFTKRLLCGLQLI